MPDAFEIPFVVDQLYRRREDIHALLGGQGQGGIATPKRTPFVILFTGVGGKEHGYQDEWESPDCYLYYGEGQKGDMVMRGGNRAIRDHIKNGKRLLLFRMLGKQKPCSYLGEFELMSWYEAPNTPATRGPDRTAIVFKLKLLTDPSKPLGTSIGEPSAQEMAMSSTVAMRLTEVRTQQDLFRKRLRSIETRCRLTGLDDARFLRASHIKPWAACEQGEERVDGCNGLLFAPHADLLFDRGWISFEDNGRLLVSLDLPPEVMAAMGMPLHPGRRCGSFTDRQKGYLQYHRAHVFGKKYKKRSDPVQDLYGDVMLLR